jgi:hypothetical protein
MSEPSSTKTTISITEFSRNPSGRYPKDGPDNGESFRKQFLVPALKRSKVVIVNIDGAAGVPSSFLDEAFGGLVRTEGFGVPELHERLRVICTQSELERYVPLIWRYIDREAATAVQKR